MQLKKIVSEFLGTDVPETSRAVQRHVESLPRAYERAYASARHLQVPTKYRKPIERNFAKATKYAQGIRLPKSLPPATYGNVLIAAGGIAGIVAVGFIARAVIKRSHERHARHDLHTRNDQRLRNGLSEKHIDKTLMDSFPASDPAGNY